MKIRHVYSAPDIATAEEAVEALRSVGIAAEGISLIARQDIELTQIGDEHIEHRNDFAQGALKGVVGGAGSGLLVGLVAMAVPPLGLTFAGLAALTVGGAAVGSWAGMLAGASVPDTVRQKFEDEIANGHVLVVVDGNGRVLEEVAAALHSVDVRLLPFHTPTAIS